jgi:hypothetical protein
MADKRNDTGDEERRAKLLKAGVTVGIGSAAIVAALLYASTIKKKPPSPSSCRCMSDQFLFQWSWAMHSRAPELTHATRTPCTSSQPMISKSVRIVSRVARQSTG